MHTAINRQTPILMLMGDSYSSTSEIQANSIRNILFKLNLSNAPVKYPTASKFGWAYQGRAIQAPASAQVVGFRDDVADRILDSLDPYLTQEKLRQLEMSKGWKY